MSGRHLETSPVSWTGSPVECERECDRGFRMHRLCREGLDRASSPGDDKCPCFKGGPVCRGTSLARICRRAMCACGYDSIHKEYIF